MMENLKKKKAYSYFCQYSIDLYSKHSWQCDWSINLTQAQIGGKKNWWMDKPLKKILTEVQVLPIMSQWSYCGSQ